MNDTAHRYQLGMHTYSLHLSGLGESWGFEQTTRSRGPLIYSS